MPRSPRSGSPPYGFFLDWARSDRSLAPTHPVFFDGRVMRRLPGEPLDVHVSPGGRYAGWIDLHGPRRLFDRVAQVVVVDVRTGDVVYRSAKGMGDWLGRNVPETYEGEQPSFVGFDRQHAYYVDSDDNQLIRSVDLRTPRVRDAPRSVGFFGGRDDDVGARVIVDHGRVERGAAAREGGSFGVRSPDGRFVVTFGDNGRFVVSEAATGQRVDLAGLGRQAFFGGWLEEGSAFYTQSQRRAASDADPTSGRGGGEIVRCTLPQGACATQSEVRSARPVVLPADAVLDF